MNPEELQSLLKSITSLPCETEWVEFKHNQGDPSEVGELLSALSNSAALHRREAGYLIWGIADQQPHLVVGTTFSPRQQKVGNEELENWLATLLSPRIHFQIHEVEFDGKHLVVFWIQPAPNQPVRFRGTEYIRVGTYRKPLREHPEKERALWAMFSHVPFEKKVALASVRPEQALRLLDYPKMFQLLGGSLPEDRNAVLERMSQEKVILRRDAEHFDVTNLGAILFARRLGEFDPLARKALRVVIYRGASRIETVREKVCEQGYAVGFEDVIQYIDDLLPRNEQIGLALRKQVRMYPEVAIRELAANALIHQDFAITGTGPMVEIFTDRIEVTNPGTPLIDTLRFIDEPPQSRNEALAALMRRMNICEERGSGIDKVVSAVEMFQLPAPDFTTTQNHTKATLFAYRKLAGMDKSDRTRACYQHACLCCVANRRLTNDSLRKRFAISDANYSMASRIIRDTVHRGLIKQFDPENRSRKHASYVPFWA